ncbi:hybrid sensory kinase [Clostridium sp. CAG:302]|nr:hybrid sensory kinase [Clostridium sp. CAG:302]
MYSICFTIAGVIFSILLFVLYNFKSNLKLLENKIYYGIIVTTIISGLIEIYSFILVRTSIFVNSVLYLFSLKSLFLCFLVWIYLFTIYTVIVTINLKNKDYSRYRLAIIISTIVFIIVSLTTMILPIDIIETDGLLLPTGVGVDIIYVLSLILFIIMISVIISNRRNLKNKKYYPMYFLLVILGIMIIVQKIFPSLLLINFSLSILIYIMYFTIENPDIKLIKDLSYTRRMLEKQNEMVSGTVNNLAISLKNPLMEITNFSSKKINKKDEVSSLEEIKKFQKLSLNLVDQINKIMDLTRIENRQLKIKNKLYQTDNLINSIKDIINFRNVDINYNIDNNIPKVLYGDDDNIKQTFTYLVEFINNYFNRYDLTINISKISVRNNCKLMFSIIVNYKNTKLDFIERDNKCIIETNAWEYELYNRLVELQKGTYEVKKDNSSLIFNFALFQKIKDNNEVVEEEVIKYNNYSGKKILIALDNHLDINKFTELLVNYNVDISTSSSIEELTELLRSDKTFDIVFLSNTISGIENYNITTSEERKRTMTKLSLIAGYKLQIIMVTLEDYKDSDTEYIKMPISKVKLDDIMVKYLN